MSIDTRETAVITAADQASALNPPHVFICKHLSIPEKTDQRLLFDQAAFSTSKTVTNIYSTSFSMAVRFLEPEIQRAIHSIYGFVRIADEIVDTFHGEDQHRLLEDFEHDYRKAVEDGISLNPILHSFQMTIRKYRIPESLVQAFLKSMRSDLHKDEYKDAAELNEYIYGSADVVGLMCLLVFVKGDVQAYEQLLAPAMKLGSAFQKVNFLRDLGNDMGHLGRKYFPEVHADSFNEATKSAIIENIEEDFAVAYTGILRLPGKSKLAVLIAYYYYKRLLRNIRATPAQTILYSRVRVSGFMKAILFAKAYVAFTLRMV